MNWPMDPEEEKILRSSSPYVVPEVIVQRNERVKSILKKNNFNSLNDIYKNANETSASVSVNLNNVSMTSEDVSNQSVLTSVGGQGHQSTANMASPFSGKKRVDFRDNFCFVNFFDSHNQVVGKSNGANVVKISIKSSSSVAGNAKMMTNKKELVKEKLDEASTTA
jgi:hypothetical protein